MIESASNLAQYIIAHFFAKNEEINNLKLQKLLYYCQAWHLALHEKPLFEDRIEAWVHGPVVPNVFREYKSFRWSPVKANGLYNPNPEAKSHIDEILAAYGHFSSWDLERLTHNDAPWKEARGGLPPDVPSNNVISHESMKNFYRQQ